MSLEGLSFVKMSAIFKVINATDSPIQNFASLSLLIPLGYFKLETLETMLIYVRQCSKSD